MNAAGREDAEFEALVYLSAIESWMQAGFSPFYDAARSLHDRREEVLSSLRKFPGMARFCLDYRKEELGR